MNNDPHNVEDWAESCAKRDVDESARTTPKAARPLQWSDWVPVFAIIGFLATVAWALELLVFTIKALMGWPQ